MDTDSEKEIVHLRKVVEALSARVERLEVQFGERASLPVSESLVSEQIESYSGTLQKGNDEPISRYIDGTNLVDSSTPPADQQEFSPAPGLGENGHSSSPIDERVSSPTDERVSSPTDEKTSSHVDEKTSSQVDEKTSSPIDEKTSPPIEEKTSHTTDEQQSSGEYGKQKASSESHQKEFRSSSQKDEQGTEQAASLETRIGLYWLSRLGIGFLVVGVALLILYSFQYFGAWAKLLTGFFVAAGLIGLGEFVDSKQKMKSYGNVLVGGGWSLAYFTSYAMHFVNDVKVIDDPIMGSSMMLAIAGAAVVHSLKKNSELIATLAILLGFITLALTERGLFSATASMILTGAMTYLVYKCKWTSLYSIGFLAAFSFEFFTPNPHYSQDIAIKLAYVFPYWLSSALLPIALGEESPQSKRALVGIGIVAAVASFASIRPVFSALNSNADAYIYAAGAGLYAGLAWVMSRRGCATTSLIDGLLSLSSIALLIPALNDGPVELIAWAVQLGIIVWAGLSYNLRSFRWFAYPLSLILFGACIGEMTDKKTFVLLGMNFPWSAVHIFPAALALAGASLAYQGEKFKNVVSDTVRAVSFYWYFHLCGVISTCLIPLIVSADFDGITSPGTGFIIIGWSLQALAVALLALKWQRPYLVLASILGFILAFTASMFTTSSPNHVIPSLCGIAMVFAMAFKWRGSTPGLMRPRDLFGIYFITAAIWLLCYQGVRLETVQLRSFALLAELLIYIIVGIRMNEVLIRTCGVLSGTMLMFGIVFESQLDWLTMIPSVAALYAAGHMYRQLQFGDKLDGTRRIVRNYFNCGATLALTSFIGWHLERYFVSCGWAVEGLLLLAAGFLLSDKIFRVSGLLVFALLVCRLLIYDLAEAGTIYRIVAFIVAGVILMVAAYAYSWFSKKLAASSTKS